MMISCLRIHFINRIKKVLILVLITSKITSTTDLNCQSMKNIQRDEMMNIMTKSIEVGETIPSKYDQNVIQRIYQILGAVFSQSKTIFMKYYINKNISKSSSTSLLTCFVKLDIPFQITNQINKRISKLKNLSSIIKGTQNQKKRNIQETISTIVPSFRWSQSLNNIFLEVKFAHRFDAPAAIEVSQPNVSFTNSTLSLRAVTDKNKGQNVNFELDLEFFGVIDVETTVWEKNGVGRVFFNITKEEQPSRWKRLLSDKSHQQLKPKMQFWVEMYLKYENELESYEPTEDGPINQRKNNNRVPDYKKNPKDEATDKALEDKQEAQQNDESGKQRQQIEQNEDEKQQQDL